MRKLTDCLYGISRVCYVDLPPVANRFIYNNAKLSGTVPSQLAACTALRLMYIGCCLATLRPLLLFVSITIVLSCYDYYFCIVL